MLTRRSPHGERGLKFIPRHIDRIGVWSLSSWRAWIEIDTPSPRFAVRIVALLMESVD